MFINFFSNKKYCFNFTRLQLLNLSLHLGHSKLKWLWYFKPYISLLYKNNIILNLDIILYTLKRSLLFIGYLLQNYGKIFSVSSFVNYKFNGLSSYFLQKIKCGFYDGKYVGGLVSNFFQIKTMKKAFYYQFITNLYKIKYLPSCFLIFDSNKFYSCFTEASYINIPSIGFIDTDLNYKNCLYPIVANNESFFIYLYYLILVVFLYKNKTIDNKKYYFSFVISLYMYILRYLLYFILIRTILCLKKKAEYNRKKVKMKFKYVSFARFLFFLFKKFYNVEFDFLLYNPFAFKPKYYQIRVYTLPVIFKFFLIVIRTRLHFLMKILRFLKYKCNIYIYKLGKILLYLANKYKFGELYNNLILFISETRILYETTLVKYNRRLRLIFNPVIVHSLLLYFKLVAFFFSYRLFFLVILSLFKFKQMVYVFWACYWGFLISDLYRYYQTSLFRLRHVFFRSRFFLKNKIIRRQKKFFLYFKIIKQFRKSKIYFNKYLYFRNFFKGFLKEYKFFIGKQYYIFKKASYTLPLNWRLTKVKYPFIRYNYKVNVWHYVLPYVIKKFLVLARRRFIPNFDKLIVLVDKMNLALLHFNKKKWRASRGSRFFFSKGKRKYLKYNLFNKNKLFKKNKFIKNRNMYKYKNYSKDNLFRVLNRSRNKYNKYRKPNFKKKGG